MEEDAGADGLSPPAAGRSSAVVVLGEAASGQAGVGETGSEPTTESCPANAGQGCGGDPDGPVVSAGQDIGARPANVAEQTQAVWGPPDAWGSRLRARWLGCIAAALTLLASATMASGYWALRAHRDSQAITGANAAAVVAAQDCVAATQPPDAAGLAASQRKLSECSTRDFGAQIAWYGAVLAEAYQGASIHVKVPDMRGAVERDNDDGSVVVLVAFRTKVSQVGMADQENNYRLRVKMVPENGQFKVAELDQVAK
jgi:Mce-associated membrane protein